jgi:hypothetical protein
MRRAGPILLLIATLTVAAVMYFVPAGLSRRYAFGWELTAFEIFMALPLIFIIASVVLLLLPAKARGPGVHIKLPKGWRRATVRPTSLSVMATIVLICLLCWLASLFVIYVADDLTSPAWDERSVPAPRTY